MPTTIEVTAEDIAAGKPGNCARCPIALAASRAFNGMVEALPFALIEFGGRTLAYLPWEAREWMNSFDRGGEVAPITFEV